MDWQAQAARWRKAYHALEAEIDRGEYKPRKNKKTPAKKRVVKKKAKKAVKNVKKSVQGSFDFI